MKKCPICRASRTEEIFCRRCGADLTWVLDTQRLGESLLASAMTALGHGDQRQAQALARRACLVHSTPFSQTVDRFLTHLVSCESSQREETEDLDVLVSPPAEGAWIEMVEQSFVECADDKSDYEDLGVEEEPPKSWLAALKGGGGKVPKVLTWIFSRKGNRSPS